MRTTGDLRDNPPAVGAGAQPACCGWQLAVELDVRLTGSWQEIDERRVAACSVGGDNNDYGAAVWTGRAGAEREQADQLPSIGTRCSPSAIWDGGRLRPMPNGAGNKAGGRRNRVFPYGNDAPTWLARMT